MVGVAGTGEGLLSGADPAWARGSPQHPWGLAGNTPPPQPANPGAPRGSSVSPSVKWGVCSTKATPITGGPLQAALPASSSPFSARLRRLSQHTLFGFHRGLTAWGSLREVPSALTPPTRGGRRAGLRVHQREECLPPVPLSSAGRASGRARSHWSPFAVANLL